MTPASTALLQFEIDQPLIHLSRKVGRERAVRAYWRSATAVDFLRGRIADLGLRCAFRERQNVYLPGDVLNVSELKQEAAARASKASLEKSGRFARPIVTEISPARPFWRAEEYHQRYFEKRGGGSCHV